MVQVSLMQAQVASQSGAGTHLYAAGRASFDDLMPIAEQRRVCQSILAGDSEAAVSAFDALMKKLQNVTLGNAFRTNGIFSCWNPLGTLREELGSDLACEWDVDSMIQLYAGRRDERFREFIRRLAVKVRAEREKKCGVRQNAIAGLRCRTYSRSRALARPVASAFNARKAPSFPRCAKAPA